MKTMSTAEAFRARVKSIVENGVVAQVGLGEGEGHE